MKESYIEGQRCVGPNFSQAELALIKRNLAAQKGLDTLAEVLSAVGNPQRLKILYLLHAHREMCVCDLAEVLELTDSAVSQHLRRLKDKNLVQARRQGQTIFYTLVPNPVTTKLEELFAMEETKQPYAFIHKEVTS